MAMKTSAFGVLCIRQREGCRLHAYKDSVGVTTIGVGHTGRASPPVPYLGLTITQEQADAFLAADLVPFERAVNGAVTRPMTQNQFDAMVSLAFNIGETGFRKSSVVRLFNGGDARAAAEAFMMWVRPAVLEGRRKAERAQFLMESGPPAVVVDVPPAQLPPPVTSPGPVAPHDTAPAPVPETWGAWFQRMFFKRSAA